VIVFTGGERYFSTGFDLNEIRKLQKVWNEAYTALIHRAYRAILFCEQLVVAAVAGPAIPGGFDLTMMCDLRYTSERAKFGQRRSRCRSRRSWIILADHRSGAGEASGAGRAIATTIGYASQKASVWPTRFCIKIWSVRCAHRNGCSGPTSRRGTITRESTRCRRSWLQPRRSSATSRRGRGSPRRDASSGR
jgi:hypothetical protein